ncbi:hypothetical protein IFM46972_02046 [Aspergillus udagawae]|uniref:Pre-mRNA-splicing factor 38B n=1 Tax=Aspergillus udagawae TaxID=91492 RepID=A0A8H3NDG8_9EURO|nr:hypothetical protein IFM46972_02046 [Aspergillus udagawae]
MPSNTGGTNDELSNDYVAQVLAQEARDSSMKYSAQGLGAYLPRRPTAAAPKPNTRFLRNIIKETDSHNAALKRKEEKEARERMRLLRGQASSSSTNDTKGRDRPRSRRPSDNLESRRDTKESRESRHRPHRRSHRSRSASSDRDRPRRHRRTHRSDDTGEKRHRSSRKEHHRRSYSRSRSPRDDNASNSRDRYRRRRQRTVSLSPLRSPSPDRHRNRKGGEDTRYDTRRSSRDDRATRAHSTAHERERPPPPPRRESGFESDPLEDLVGPLPPKHGVDSDSGPIRSRGRGAYKANMSNIDAHFAPDYDPSLDVHMEDDDRDQRKGPSRRPVAGLTTEEDDWELALEALRDRARWKQKGEERLREAGFNDAVVDRWKSTSSKTATSGGDDEGRLEDVKWSKKGEDREWDRGKFVNDEGHIDVKALW